MISRNQRGLMLAILFCITGLAPKVIAANPVNEATKMTFSEPVEIPGRVLPAGTYWFLRMTQPLELNVVQVYDATRTHLITTIPCAAADLVTTPRVTEVTFTEPGGASPAALLTWFYEGNAYGQRFYYSPRELARIHEQGTFTATADPASSDGVVILSASLQ